MSDPLELTETQATPRERQSASCCGSLAGLASACCAPVASVQAAPDDVRTAVREHYAERARSAPTSCCGGNALYGADTLADLPAEIANFSLGCGNPIALATLQPGETVLDLGSGGGLDCFLAAQRVGPTGRVIGVDMTAEMLTKARANAIKLNAANVEFREGYLENLPVEDASVDVVISNCVINLSPDKPRVFREVLRVLKPGGRVAVSDIVTNGPMSPIVAKGLEAWAGCIAGALDVQAYRAGLEMAGFVEIAVQPNDGGDALSKVSPVLASLPVGLPFSALITARKRV